MHCAPLWPWILVTWPPEELFQLLSQCFGSSQLFYWVLVYLFVPLGSWLLVTRHQNKCLYDSLNVFSAFFMLLSHVQGGFHKSLFWWQLKISHPIDLCIIHVLGLPMYSMTGVPLLKIVDLMSFFSEWVIHGKLSNSLWRFGMGQCRIRRRKKCTTNWP